MGTKNIREVKSRRIIAKILATEGIDITNSSKKTSKKKEQKQKINNKGKLHITSIYSIAFFFINLVIVRSPFQGLIYDWCTYL